MRFFSKFPASALAAACVLATLLVGSAAGADNAPAPAATCTIAGVTVKRAEPSKPVVMEDEITLFGDNFASLACSDPNKPLLLFLDRLALDDVVGVYVGPNAFRFKLVRGSASKTAWDNLLGRPHLGPKKFAVSLGFPGGHAAESAAQISIEALPIAWLLSGLAEFLMLAALFQQLAVKSTILRGAPPDSTKPDVKGAYSLSKTQAAWWFFVVLAAYLFIGLVVGDFTTSLNSTALTLLAIGGGTAIGAAMIGQAQQASSQTKAATRVAKANIARADQSAVADDSSAPAEPAAPAGEVARAKDVLANVSQGFFIDILSDADGVCFHRFQIVAWTVVLTGVFATGVYEDLAMPDFSATLLGLMGLSSGTYLGLKTTEAVVPSVATNT